MSLKHEIEEHNKLLYEENKVLMIDNFNKYNKVQYNGTFKFIANEIDQSDQGNWTISFKCPFCFDNYKKNGEPYLRAKNHIHIHGLDDEELKRGYISGRSSHCNKMFDYIVYIDNSTKVVPYKCV